MFTFTDEERKALQGWRDNLYATELPQTSCALRTEKGFCCLGLYLYCEYEGSNWEHSGGDSGFFYYLIEEDEGEIRKEDAGLPDMEAHRLGLDKWFTAVQENGDKSDRTIESIFIALNDDLYYTFPRIAKEIDYLLEHGNFSPEVLSYFPFEMRPLNEVD